MTGPLIHNGMKIYCTSEVWNNHILPRHPFALLYQDYFARAITNPISVRKSRNDDSVHIHYYPVGNLYFKVIIKMKKGGDGEQYGEVITAFIDEKISRREKSVQTEKK